MDAAKYECYVTVVGEVILIPTVSTRPVVYAIFEAPTMAKALELSNVLEARGVPVFSVKSFDWRDDTRMR